MSDPLERSPAESFAQFQATVEAVQHAPFTGDVSLDMLLHVLPNGMRGAVEALAVTHWFGEAAIHEVAAISGVDADELARRLVQLPIVRKHERGLTYHDVAREKLWDALFRQDSERIRTLCRRLAPHYPAPGREPTAQDIEVWAEHLYLRCAYDEEAALEEIADIFDRTRRDRAHVASQLLSSLVGEQLPLLSAKGASFYQYVNGLAAFDRRDFAEASESLTKVNGDVVSPRIRAQTALYRGWILEETGELDLAMAHYRNVLRKSAELGIDSGADGMLARLHQRSSRAALAGGLLGKAESHVRRSLEFNAKQGDIYGLALNYSLLGQINRHLGDRRAATKEFRRALELLRKMDRPYQVAEVLLHLGQVHRDGHAYEKAEAEFSEVIELKADAGDHYGLAFAYAERGRLKLLQEHTEAALQWYQASLKLLRQFKDTMKIAAVQQNMAIIYAGAERYTEAIACQRSAVEEAPLGSESHEDMTRQLGRLEARLKRSQRSWLGRNWFASVGWGSLGLLVVALGAGGLAVNGSYEDRMRARLNEIKVEMEEPGLEVILERGGSLFSQDHDDHVVAMSAGFQYEVRAVCDEDCEDLDLRLLNERGETLVEDVNSGELPVLRFEPARGSPGLFTLQIDMYACSVQPCFYAVLVARRPGEGVEERQRPDWLGQARATIQERAIIREKHEYDDP